jgi:hypothetical protein
MAVPVMDLKQCIVLPRYVFGLISPYPTVVAVTKLKYNELMKSIFSERIMVILKSIKDEIKINPAASNSLLS